MTGARAPRGAEGAAPAYLTDQLIPYIGNKRKLVDLIGHAIDATGVNAGTFFDAFSGSGAVSRLAKLRGLRVVSNDWEPYTEIINSTYVGLNRMPPFEAFGGVDAVFGRLRSIPERIGYIARHYCPADDERPDHSCERMFFTQENGRRLDAMREQVEEWRGEGLLDEPEHRLLVASLIFCTSWCSNTSGVFKGFHRGWGGATETAWYRIREPVTARPPVLHDNGQENVALRMDARAAAAEGEFDIAYLDPPYNQHQYGSNYHLLNTITLWDKPDIPPRFTPGRGIKAAIRSDWRTARNSAYCHRNSAERELESLLDALRARWILMSYSTDGLIPMDHLVDILGRAGRLSWVHRPYRRYRVSSQRPSPRAQTLEFVLIVERGARMDNRSRDEILALCGARSGPVGAAPVKGEAQR